MAIWDNQRHVRAERVWIHLLLSDAVLSVGFVHLGSPKDHEAAIDLRKLDVVVRGDIRRLADLRGRLLGLALLAEGATDVALDGGAVFEEVLRLPPMEQEGGLKRLLEVLGARTMPVGLRYDSTVSRGHRLLPTTLLVLVPLVAVALGRSGVVAAIPTAEVADGFGFAAEVGLDGLLVGSILGGDV